MKLQLLILISSAVLFQYTSGAVKPRIIGGQNARAGQFPFAAAITTRTQTSQLFCGGTLYTNQWVITSGQCVVDALSFTIQLGSTHLKQSDPNRITVAADEYVLHPDFNATLFANDIGLIKLRQPIQFNDYVKSINLLPVFPIEDFSTATAYGWGQTTDDVAGESEALQYVELSCISNFECTLIYGGQITDNMVCTEGQFNEGTCIGDIGTPLIQYYSRQLSMIVAVATFLSGNGCESTNPSGYTRVYPYVNWIRETTLNFN